MELFILRVKRITAIFYRKWPLEYKTTCQLSSPNGMNDFLLAPMVIWYANYVNLFHPP